MALCRMLGYSEPELLSLKLNDIHPADTLPHILETIGSAEEVGQTPTGTIPFLRKDGSIFFAEAIGKFLIYRGKRCSMGIFRDITERKKAQEALAASEKKYRLLVETTGTGYLILDGQGRVIDANAEYVRISGHHALEDILGRTVVEWTAFYDLDRNAKEVEKCYRKGLVRQLEIDYVHADGKIIPIDINATCLDTEDGRQIVCLCRDITERREAQEALRASTERYELAVRGAGVGIWDYDVRTGKVYYSPRWRMLLGYDENDIGDSLDDWATLLHPDERDWILKFQDDFLAGTAPTVTVEYRLRHKDGSYRWIVAHGLVVRDEQGKACRLVGSHGDITDRKQAEEALQRSEERLRLAQQVAGVGTFEWNVQTGVNTWTPELEALYGLSPGSFPQTEAAWENLIYPDDRAEAMRRRVQTLETGEPAEGEWRVVWPDGSVHWLAERWQAFKDDSGKPLRLIGVNIDITDRKRTEEALRQSERRFRNYFEQGLIGMSVTSVDKRWLEVNDRLCEMLGYRREELVQTNWAVVTHPDDVEPNRRLFNPLLAGEIEHFTLNKRYLKKDGSIVHATIYTRAFRKDDATIDHIVTLIEDITARKQAEDALHESEEKYRTLVEASPDAVIMADLEGHITFVSCRALQMYGAENVEELLGRNPLDFFAPKDHQRFLTNLRRTLEEGVTNDIECDVVRKDGTHFVGETSAAAIRDISGKPTALVAVIRDITERKRAQEALLRERRTLKHMLQASDHERQLIAYDIHDGLAQELAAAIMQFDAFDHLKETKPKLAVDAYHAAMTMLRQGHFEARRLISGVRPPILDESGVLAAIAHLIHEPVFDKGPTITYRNQTTFTRLAPILENVIYRIVQESLTNARNHSKSEKILVGLVQCGDRLRIEIRDWGVGFDPKRAQENRFGLEGIRERARLLGGKCSIKSKPGEGTTIIVELPVVEKESDE